jgi:predicted anti-sigma-YlaC factor YlaD
MGERCPYFVNGERCGLHAGHSGECGQVTPAERAFYEHLDRCRQCRDRPFGLCEAGGDLLTRAAARPVVSFGPERT